MYGRVVFMELSHLNVSILICYVNIVFRLITMVDDF